MPVPLDLPAAEAAIIAKTNDFRRQNKLAPVRPNAQLTAAARAYARKLAGYSGLSHTADGTTPAERVTAGGYKYCQIGENLAALLDTRGFTAESYAARAVDGWENSPGHRKNMLLPHVTETGVGIVQTSPTQPKYIAVQLFARPEAAQYSFKVVNGTARAVVYRFDGEQSTVSPREIITHTACMPGTIAFDADAKTAARYVTRAGQVYSLKSDGTGGVAVEVGDGR